LKKKGIKIIQTSQPWPLVLGLDWGGGQSIKFLLLRRTQTGKILVERFGRIAIHSDAPEAIHDISSAIHELFLREKTFRKAKIVIGLGAEKAILKKESFPSLSPKELKQTIFFGLQKDLGREGEDVQVVCDHLVLGPDPAVEGNVEVLCFGAENQSVLEKVDLFIAERNVPVKVTPTAVALRNLFAYLPESKTDDVVCMLDIGAARSILVFFKKGNLDFHREIVIGGDDFTKAITGTIFHEGRAIQFTTKEALEFKFKHGYPLGFSEGMTFRGAPLTEVGAMMRPVVERLTGEIHRSIGFYKDRAGTDRVRELYLLGGGSQLKHLAQVLTERLDIPTHTIDPPEDVRISAGVKQEQVFRAKYLEYGNAFALALETKKDANLLPTQVLKIHQLNNIRQIATWIALGFSVLTVLILYYDNIAMHKLGMRKELAEKRAVIAENRVMRFEKAKGLNSIISGQLSDLQGKIQMDPYLVQVLRAVSNSMPKTLSLTSLRVDDVKNLKIKDKTETGKPAKPKPEANKSKQSGEAQGSEEAEAETRAIWIEGRSKVSVPDIRISVAQFMLELSKSGYLTDVNLQDESSIEETDEYLFTITGTIIQ
jgi:type IV pilus assembly protein PilM